MLQYPVCLVRLVCLVSLRAVARRMERTGLERLAAVIMLPARRSSLSLRQRRAAHTLQLVADPTRRVYLVHHLSSLLR